MRYVFAAAALVLLVVFWRPLARIDGSLPRIGALLLGFFVICNLVPRRLLLKDMRLRRRKYGQECKTCGYDLRATPDRCPECGMVPAGLPSDAPARRPADSS
jgi:hypothetical protein